jgi:hypothetical protein
MWSLKPALLSQGHVMSRASGNRVNQYISSEFPKTSFSARTVLASIVPSGLSMAACVLALRRECFCLLIEDGVRYALL